MEPGDKVSENLRIVRLLDEGSMGSVWVADHLTLRTQVAVKFMSPAIAKDPNLVTRFTREASAAAQIKSQHVVQILDHGITATGVPYIAMELLEGESLQACLKRVQRLGLVQVGAILTQVCKALSKAHALGIVHRDVKPANIFLTESDGDLLVKLLDFGVAKQADSLEMTKTQDTVGTPYYMSFEQLKSAKGVDHRGDLWSLGVVAYHALTAELPFKAKTFTDLLFAVAAGTFPAPSTYRPEIGPALDAWFVTALARDRDKRFQTAKEMAEAYDRALRG